MLDYGNIGNKSFIKLDYRLASFRGYNQTLASPFSGVSTARQGISPHRGIPGGVQTYLNSEDDYEQYSSYSLSFNYAIKEKYNLSISVPYLINVDYYGKVIQDIGPPTQEKESYNGLGDISLGVQRIFTIEKDPMKHTFKLGANLYLPTGKYDVSDILSDNIHMQPGRSVYAMDLLGSYNLEEVGFWGLNVMANYYTPFNEQSFGNKTYTYDFGNKFSIDVNWYKIFLGKFQKVIVLGLKDEMTGQESVNGLDITDTGYNILYLNLGGMVKKDQFLVKTDINLPIFQSLSGLQLKNRVKFSVSLMYYLNSSKE